MYLSMRHGERGIRFAKKRQTTWPTKNYREQCSEQKQFKFIPVDKASSSFGQQNSTSHIYREEECQNACSPSNAKHEPYATDNFQQGNSQCSEAWQGNANVSKSSNGICHVGKFHSP